MREAHLPVRLRRRKSRQLWLLVSLYTVACWFGFAFDLYLNIYVKSANDCGSVTVCVYVFASFFPSGSHPLHALFLSSSPTRPF